MDRLVLGQIPIYVLHWVLSENCSRLYIRTDFVYFPERDKSSYSKRNRFTSGASACVIRSEYLLAQFNSNYSISCRSAWYVLYVWQSRITSGRAIAYCEQIRLWYQAHRTSLFAVADYYFFMGIFALILCTAVAFRPSIFRAKGAPVGPPYPLWTNDRDQNSDTAQLREKESGSLLGIPKVHDGFNIW